MLLPPTAASPSGLQPTSHGPDCFGRPLATGCPKVGFWLRGPVPLSATQNTSRRAAVTDVVTRTSVSAGLLTLLVCSDRDWRPELDARQRRAGAKRRIASAPCAMAVNTSTRPQRWPRRRRGDAVYDQLRVPLPVPGRRREHRRRLGELERERRVRHLLHPGLGPARDHAGVHLLHDRSSRHPGGGSESDGGHGEPAEHVDDDRLLQRPEAVLPARWRVPQQPVVLHVEPDMWGYIQQRSSSDNAATRAGAGRLDRGRRAGRAAGQRLGLRPGHRQAARHRTRRTSCWATTSACGARATTFMYSNPPEQHGRRAGHSRSQLLPVAE